MNEKIWAAILRIKEIVNVLSSNFYTLLFKGYFPNLRDAGYEVLSLSLSPCFAFVLLQHNNLFSSEHCHHYIFVLNQLIMNLMCSIVPLIFHGLEPSHNIYCHTSVIWHSYSFSSMEHWYSVFSFPIKFWGLTTFTKLRNSELKAGIESFIFYCSVNERKWKPELCRTPKLLFIGISHLLFPFSAPLWFFKIL